MRHPCSGFAYATPFGCIPYDFTTPGLLTVNY